MKIIELLLEYDRMITAKNFGARLQAKFGQDRTPEEIIQAIENQDPTPNKEYTQWMVRMLLVPNRTWDIVDMNRDNLLWIHYKGKRKLRPEHRDINNFKTYAAFETTMLDPELYDLEELVRDTPKSNKGQSEEVYQDNQIRIIVPYDETAACYYGRATTWCTAYTEAPNHFDEYNAKDKLYIILIKKPRYKGEKYQLHWEGSNEVLEIKKPDDTGVNVLKIVKQYPGIKTYFLKARPEKALQYLPFYDNHTLSALYNYVSKPAIEYIKKHDKINNEDKKELIQHLLSSNDPDNIRELAYESFDNFGDNTIENLYPIDDVLSYYISEILGYSNSEGFNESQYIHDFIKKYSGM